MIKSASFVSISSKNKDKMKVANNGYFNTKKLSIGELSRASKNASNIIQKSLLSG